MKLDGIITCLGDGVRSGNQFKNCALIQSAASNPQKDEHQQAYNNLCLHAEISGIFAILSFTKRGVV